MMRKKKISTAPPDDGATAETSGFDVPLPSNPPSSEIMDQDDDNETEENLPQKPPAGEDPEQRRLMREKRRAKAEEEQLRRLARQNPLIARLVLENQTLKSQLESKK